MQTRRDFGFGAACAAGAMLSTVGRSMAHAGPHTHRVSIEKFKFVPETVTVKVGDTIEWLNTDLVPHTATAKDRSWDTGSLSKNAVGSVIVSSPGTIDYLCRFHPHMTGVVVAEPAPTSG